MEREERAGRCACPTGSTPTGVTATDRAGNGAVVQLDNVIVDTQETPIQLTIDQSFFSPDGNGVKDAVTFEFRVPVPRASSAGSSSSATRTRPPGAPSQGTLSIPASAVWDGKDDAGAPLPEGAYVAEPRDPLREREQPEGAVARDHHRRDRADRGGEGRRGGLLAQRRRQQGRGDDLPGDLRGAVLDRDDPRRRRRRKCAASCGAGGPTTASPGTAATATGKLLADGTYTYALASTDRAGNTVTSAPVTVRIDTEATPVIVATDLAVFSPERRRRQGPDQVPAHAARDRGRRRVVVPRARRGRRRRCAPSAGSNAAPGEVSWDGIDDAGKKAKDGRYAVELEVTYANGNKPKVISNQFRIDTAYPEISVSAEALLFSPDGDGRLDALAVKQISSEEDLWEGEIRDAKAERVREFFWKGKAADFAWDGKDDNGNRVPDGYYTYVVKATRQSGNATAKELRGIQVDTRPTPVYVTASAAGFSPNGDGFRDELSLHRCSSTVKEGIKSWKLVARAPLGGQPEGVRRHGRAARVRHLGREGRLPDRARGDLHGGVQRRVREGQPARGAHAGPSGST